jgi:hypothetical protein
LNKDDPMAKRKRHEDNSKRQQPVQQQRAEAARQAVSQTKRSKNTDSSAEARSAEKDK